MSPPPTPIAPANASFIIFRHCLATRWRHKKGRMLSGHTNSGREPATCVQPLVSLETPPRPHRCRHVSPANGLKVSLAISQHSSKRRFPNLRGRLCSPMISRALLWLSTEDARSLKLTRSKVFLVRNGLLLIAGSSANTYVTSSGALKRMI